MTKFCGSCGTALRPEAKFCAACGNPLRTVVQPPALEYSDRQSFTRHLANPQMAAVWIVGAVVAIALIGSVLGWFGRDHSSGGEQVAEGLSTVNSNGSLTQQWFDEYKDDFLSDQVTQFVTGTAQARSYPTSRGSTIIATLQQDLQIQGRWVKGADPTTRWLRTNNGTYVWDGNLADTIAMTAASVGEVIDDACQGEGCFMYLEGGLRALENGPIMSKVNSEDIVGYFGRGANATVLGSSIVIQAAGSAVVTCTTYRASTYGSSSTAVYDFRRGDRLQMLFYAGEGYSVAREPSGSLVSVEDTCLNYAQKYQATDWVMVQVIGGARGWTKAKYFEPIIEGL